MLPLLSPVASERQLAAPAEEGEGLGLESQRLLGEEPRRSDAGAERGDAGTAPTDDEGVATPSSPVPTQDPKPWALIPAATSVLGCGAP